MKFEIELNEMAIPGQFTEEQVMAVAAVAEAQQTTVKVYSAESGEFYGSFGTVFMARRFFTDQPWNPVVTFTPGRVFLPVQK